MKDWRNTLITKERPMIEAMKIIDTAALQIALVVDDARRLIGIVTDGDIRRALLKGMSLSEPIEKVMTVDFTVARPGQRNDDLIALMKSKDLRQIPIVNGQGEVVDLKILVDLVQLPGRDNWVVIMAGGQGERLQPLTNDMPKPLLKVGRKPLLETIIENFVEFGFRRYFVSVNYLADKIEAFLGDGSRWGVDIRYLRESRKMGTAGALTLLPEHPDRACIVMNGDVLTRVNWQHLLDFHDAHHAQATICVKEYHFQVPYGVIKTDQHRLAGIDEKPVHHFFVNAGIYVLEPEILAFIPKDRPSDMTGVFEELLRRRCETVAFPIREYWMDIGRMEDYEQANRDYHNQAEDKGEQAERP